MKKLYNSIGNKIVNWFVSNLGLVVLVSLLFSALSPLIFVKSLSGISFMNTGQIGDTIGGITSPFINGLGALLVYLAFKEQRVANEMTKQQQQITHIESQINRLEDNIPKMREVADKIDLDYMLTLQDPNNINAEQHVISNVVNRHLINEATYLTVVFEDCVNQCDLVGADAKYLRNRIGILFRVVYQDCFNQIWLALNPLRNTNDLPLIELLLEIQKINKLLGNPPS